MHMLGILIQFFIDLLHAWRPLGLPIGLAWLVALKGPQVIRTARRNAEIRAERARRDAYRAPVIDITPYLPMHDTGSHHSA